jgi:uncharacterized protein (DUF2126 family)
MGIRVALRHRTEYRYDRSVRLGPQVVRLRPAPHCRTPILGYSLRVRPEPHFLHWQQDPHGNFLARVLVPEPTRSFEIDVDLVAELEAHNPFDFFLEPSAELWPFEYEPWLLGELRPFLESDPPGPRLAGRLARVPRTPTSTVELLVGLNRDLQREVEYLIRLEPGVQSGEETLERAQGSCRDTAWLLVCMLRGLGIAARFASGYLIQLAPDQPPLEGPPGPKEDLTDLHAWAEAYLPGAGWIGLDPTSGLLAGEGHLPLACGPTPRTAAPVTGEVERSEVELRHSMSVERIRETPRVTRPYSEAQWMAIDRLGLEVDRRLCAGDVRLTMGGEPTFVSIDDMEADEWNSEALGPTKRARADALARRLWRRFAPGGALHHGQGKWYPGEPLPRWALSIFWRDDGHALWRDPRRIAREDVDHAPTLGQADRLVHRLAHRLGVDPGCALHAFEDPVRSPEGTHVASAVAVVMPLQVWNARDGRRWATERWSFSQGCLRLIPGDSPAGLRLPLASLPPLAPGLDPQVIQADPSAPRAPLDAPDARRQAFLQSAVTEGAGLETAGSLAPASGPPVRTALVVEPRDGRLCVFLPPLPAADDFVELLAAVEDAVGELQLAVHLEGYPPAPDARLQQIQVTPDPGVIEVNVHPARSWAELSATTTALYEEARAVRLGSEKFMLDGRHTGTGGGNHMVIGGPTPLQSPLLRRPDLLRSLLAYWNNHPGLSYLFSGLFIGPTSQAPRVDEARHDALFELELAFAEVPDPGDAPPAPWLVDRLFRDLLVDVSGNTHRAEFCIDKLYSPDQASGRRGLLELRAFEMPPHARMSLAQQLLLRALIAHFWESPYRAPLSRFGTALHDRFMLPHFVWEDHRAVLDDLRRAGFAFEDAWYAPHFEFRFPRYGSVQLDDMELELRGALEPWHVLGEDGRAGATVRYVDSSLERLQVRVRGLLGERYAVGCNGVRLPLAPTGTQGEGVCGVRFRAWRPARCLHPTIPVHAPLRFDLVDTWNDRALCGGTYHVAHPGGRNFERFPVNALEAEGRRLARFETLGHTPGPIRLAEPGRSADFPLTLDLRRAGTRP